ncbi:MAG: DNA translocase FtsK 4TM domain-containing protein [Anaerovoracaceae bacterium]|jgi:S-DNA-T family DNA segregation ATPase FtsK/SpoIIIE
MAEKKTKSRQTGKKTGGSKSKNAKSTAKKSTADKKSSKPSAKKSAPKEAAPEKKDHRLRDDIIAVVLLAFGIFLAVAMHTKMAGAVGISVSNALKGIFGFGALILPYFIIAFAVCEFIRITAPFKARTFVMLAVLFLDIDLVNAARFRIVPVMDMNGLKAAYDSGVLLKGAGVFGTYAGGGIVKLIGRPGLYIFAVLVAVISAMIIFNTPISRLFEKAAERRAALKKRREEKELEIIKEAEEKEAEARELEAKREAVGNAGRKTRADYTPPSESVAGLAGAGAAGAISPSESQKKNRWASFFSSGKKKTDVPASDSYIDNLPENKRNIITMASRNDLFDGQDSTEPVFVDTETGQRRIQISGADGAATPVGGNGKVTQGFEGGDTGSQDDFGSKSKKDAAKEAARAAGAMAAGAGIAAATAEVMDDIEKSEKKTTNRYRLPPIDLLERTEQPKKRAGLEQSLDSKADLLEQTLQSFNVNAKVVNVISGPSVTRYEIQPEIGVKVSSITNLADDIALNLRAKSIRIEAPIPGKAAIGVEVENEEREMVRIRELIASKEFRQHKSKLAFTVGRDISGKPVIADLDRMPHLLIAGATGSGKSVCINTIIMSVLYKAKPDEVKLLLVDPKMVELGNYNGIPHLLIPVVTDASKAAAALNWAVGEMTKRYNKFSSEGVRNINAYNELMRKRGDREEVMPRVVIIIDELADLMMVAKSQVEDSICRLAQLARAAGMHLIVATQRPSVDVVTGLIKANIPSRMAFMVSSGTDSRTIIDMNGAEKLVGNGDCLFKPQDLDKPIRVQCPFVSDEEVENVIEYVKGQVEDVEYSEDVIKNVEKGASGAGSRDDDDVLLPDAIECVVLAGQASVSMLQRRFRIGYNRAARIVDIMEERGIVGPQDGSRPRQVNMTEEELRELQDSGEL